MSDLTEDERLRLIDIKLKLAQARQSQPTQEATVEQPTDDSRPSMASSALQGFGQGGTLGFLPWLQAKAQQAGEGIGQIGEGEFQRGLSNVGSALAGLNPTTAPFTAMTPDTGDFNVYRQQFANEDKKKREANPLTYGGSAFLGGMAMPLPGGGALKGAGFLKNVGQAVKTGAGMGALAGFGNAASEGMDLPDTAMNAVKGAGWGGAVGAGLGAAGYGIQRLAEGGRGVSASGLLRSLGANKKEIRGVNRGPTSNTELARDAIDSGILGPGGFGTVGGVAERAEAVSGAREGQLQGVLQSIDKGEKNVNPVDLMAELQALKEAGLREGKGVNEGYIKKIDDLIDNVAATAEARGESEGMSLADVNQYLKRPLSKAKGDAMRSLVTPEGAKLGASHGYDTTRRFIEGQAERLAGPESREALIAANRELGKSTQIGKFLDELKQRDAANKMFGLSEQNAATAGAAGSQSILAGGLTGLGMSAVRNFGLRPAFAAGFRATDAISKVAPEAIQSIAGQLGGSGANALSQYLGVEQPQETTEPQDQPIQPSDLQAAKDDFVRRGRVGGR